MNREFAASKKLLQSTLPLLRSNNLEVEKEEQLTVYAATNLQMSACRKYRQIIALCELCQTDGAEIIVRSLFEVMLAKLFISHERIKFCNPSGNGSIRGLDDLASNRIVRTKMYLAFRDLQYEKWLRKVKQIPSRKDWATKQNKNVESYLKKILGESRVERLKKGSNCAGIGFPELAFSLGDEVYNVYWRVYCRQSALVHASWGGSYSALLSGDDPGSKISWFDDSEQVIFRSLLHGATLFAICSEVYAVLTERPPLREPIQNAMKELNELNDEYEKKYSDERKETKNE